MDRKTIQLMFALLRSAINGKELTQAEREQISEERVQAVFTLSEKHDLAHLVAFGLKQNGYEWDAKKSILKAVYRYERLNFELERLCRALEEAKICFIPLKGTVLRKYYPEAWMRTSCDVDVLVHEEDVETAAAVLEKCCGYIRGEKNGHDISFFTPGKEHIELHYDLVEDGIANASSRVLKAVWETATLREEQTHWYEMPDAVFYFYHIAHMAKHIENGGCGIRPFIDLWILDRIEGADLKKRDELLRSGELLIFAEAARRLSSMWMEEREADAVSQQLEEYVLCGGVYGSNENRITVQQQKKGGAVRYALSRIFLPYDTLKFHYPILEKHRWLTAVMQVRRWCKLVFCGHRRRVLRELSFNKGISASEAENARKLLKSIGL